MTGEREGDVGWRRRGRRRGAGEGEVQAEALVGADVVGGEDDERGGGINLCDGDVAAGVVPFLPLNELSRARGSN